MVAVGLWLWQAAKRASELAPEWLDAKVRRKHQPARSTARLLWWMDGWPLRDGQA